MVPSFTHRLRHNAAYGIEVTRQTIESDDPTKVAGARIAVKWKEIFEATRAAYLNGVAKIGISHRAVRLRIIQRMVEKAEDQGNSSLVAQMLERAAKEMGDAYSNRRQHQYAGTVMSIVVSQEHPEL